ncbi:MAG TPA: TIGR01777 family protein [Anaerolinea thermolimosa]|uniref:TIGR01777 family protein n=1 Tax=Anaerolinea thermolimosa TaxID=229919 RepID=A0A3D1JDN8_9CHLR|nr:TIGR01777 family oxidoreductase [Anaerolinea thermolimosa]GAP05685.1 TIGR01777 family protein [Anaerolinea thermolimosa]HCE16367.1 TIGR01777 family protein [Anaerolinea thermolimosa]
MKFIILGGSGLIGRALSRALGQAGHEVVVVSRSPERVPPVERVSVAGWDGHSAEGWGRLVDGADGIVNLAGESIGAGRWSEARKQRILTSREQAGAAIVEAVHAATRKPGVVFQISGVGYYGIGGDRPFTENDPPGSDFLASVAVRWEAATRPVEEEGVRRVIGRTGVVLTPRGGVLPRMMLPFRFFVGGPLGTGKQWISWIHLEDTVRGIQFMLENPACTGVYNLTSPQPVTNAEFVKTLGRVLRRPCWLPVPALALKIILGEMSTLILDGQRVIPTRLEEAGFPFRFARLESALRDLLV